MSRLVVVMALLLWAGSTLVLSELRWFSRTTLTTRLQPYAPGQGGRLVRKGIFSAESFRDVMGPLASELGSRISRLFGVTEDVSRRLERIHSPLDATAFRLRQLGAGASALGVTMLFAVAAQLGVLLLLLLVFGSPLLVFLLLEQQLVSASARWQRRVFLELPVVAEQLAMLLAAGFSLGSALNRLAERSHGAVGSDLVRVRNRTRQGVTSIQALGEWAALERVDALTRLVPVLALHAEASDLGRLVSEEARSIRLEVQRSTVITMEKRAQQVWIPVTVATLVPGVIFLAVPFIQALQMFSNP